MRPGVLSRAHSFRAMLNPQLTSSLACTRKLSLESVPLRNIYWQFNGSSLAGSTNSTLSNYCLLNGLFSVLFQLEFFAVSRNFHCPTVSFANVLRHRCGGFRFAVGGENSFRRAFQT